MASSVLKDFRHCARERSTVSRRWLHSDPFVVVVMVSIESRFVVGLGLVHCNGEGEGLDDEVGLCCVC